MIVSGQVTVTTAGTAVQAGTSEAKRKYWFRAHPDNTNDISIGNDGADDVTVNNGLLLKNTDPPILVECALSELYVDGDANGNKLCWLAVL